MEDSCPATPLVLTGRDSKSPLQVALSSPESDGMKSPSPGSPDSRCVICLGRLQNKSFTDSCLHQFCFQCLLQWSKIKAECPLCKQPFKSIIHNVRSNLDYDQYHVEHEEPRYVLSDLMHSYNFDFIPVDRRFRYRSTMTREYFRELAESFLAHTRRLPEDSYQITPFVPVDPTPASSVRRSNRLQSNLSQHRIRQRGTSDFRRNIYAQDLWAQDLADLSGRYRECTPQFYRNNPAQIHRIIPWLNREVNVLLRDCESQAAYVLSRIVSLLSQYPIRSKEFREQIQSYFGDRTDHFIHELYIFARSLYDMAGFDQNAVYGTNPNYATEVQEISSSSDNDSDIEILETVKVEEKKPKKPSQQGLKKLLLKRAGEPEAASRSDEPVAGPSGISSSKASASIDICESDPEDVKVLDYVKPEPEIVTLSSGDEVHPYSDLDSSNGEYAKVVQQNLSRGSVRAEIEEAEKKSSRSRSGKGKCRSNGFGLKGKQKKKYIKSRRRRSRSCSSYTSSSGTETSSRSSSSSSSSSSESASSSCSSTNSGSTSSSSTSSSSKSSVTESRGGSFSRDMNRNSQSSHRSSGKSKKKKTKLYRKKFKKKVGHRSGKRRKSSDEGEKRSRKRVKSCVIVPSWTRDGSPSFSRKREKRESVREKPEGFKSYWSIALSDMSCDWRDSSERATSSSSSSRRKHRECRSKRERDASNSSVGSIISETGNKSNVPTPGHHTDVLQPSTTTSGFSFVDSNSQSKALNQD